MFKTRRKLIEVGRPRLILKLGLFEEGFSLGLFGLWIRLPFLNRWRWEPAEMMESWGFSYGDTAFHLTWGRHSKVIWAPWGYEQVSRLVRRADGSWVPYVGSYEDKEPDGRHETKHSYRYVLECGEIQERIATIYVDRSERRQRWLKWCPWFAKTTQYIEVQFDDEVGECSGSWKGGCIGCGYEMNPGETPLQTLRRMERDRKF